MIRRGLFDGGCGWVGHRVGWMLPGMGGGGGMVSGLITTSSVKRRQRHSVACGGVPCAGWVIAGRGGCHAALWPFCGSHAIRSGFRVDGSGIVSAGFLINALFVSSVALLMKACLFCIHATVLQGNCHIVSPNPCFADAFLHYSIFHLLSCLIPFPFFLMFRN